MPTVARPAEDLLDLPEEIDEELVQLPDPPRKERRATVWILGFAAIASAGMSLALARDAAYALAPSSATDLGDLKAAEATGFVPNSYVSGHGMTAGANGIRYERPFESDSYRLAPVAGRNDVWVEVQIPPGEESSRYVPKQAFSGRLIPFDKAGLRHRSLKGAVQDGTGQVVPANAWLLVDGHEPRDARFIVALLAMFIVFFTWNVGTIYRLLRKVR